MKVKTLYLLLGLAVVAALFGCERKTTYVEQVTGPLTCAQCHDSSNLITGKETEWATSGHGTGTAYLRATSADCAGCHSGHAFAQRIAAGLNPDQVTQGDPNPTRQDCRACHKIHETYTEADFALRTETPVKFFALANATFDGGEGNLCVNCHQPRRAFPAAVNDSISGISSHWGLHHGPQSAMLLGVGGAGVAKMVSGHYGAVSNTCVTCHLGAERNHTFDPTNAVNKDGDLVCKSCHPDAKNVDVDGKQTEIAGLADSLATELYNLGLIDANSLDASPAVSKTSLPKAIALWNWVFVTKDDGSMGVHNYDYAKALLEEGLNQLAAPATVSAQPLKRPDEGGSK